MKTIRTSLVVLSVSALLTAAPASAQQCCLSGLFAGCGSCFRTAPTYAVAPMVAPVAAPIAAPPPPVMVPVQQTSYVPETTYRTQYQSVPVTSYKPSCEIDPCTGCPVECMQPVTQYVQQAVNVPVTQYRAVTTTKYVQMQPGYAPGAVGAPIAYPAGPALPGPATPAASPFATPAVQAAPPVQTVPQGWGAAGADVMTQQVVPGQPSINPPALPATGYPATQVVPQAGTTYLPPSAPLQPQPQPTAPPTLTPAPAMKPIPELPRTTPSGTALPVAPTLPTTPVLPTTPAAPATGAVAPPSLLPGSGSAAPVLPPSTSGAPMLKGSGPSGATHAFPRLLEPTNHTTSWQPATDVTVPAPFAPAYPTAALPSRLSR